MTNVIPPAPPAPLTDTRHDPAVAPSTPAPTVSVGAMPLGDVVHPAAVAANPELYPVTASDPLPIREPVPVQVSPVTVDPQPIADKASFITDIAPEETPYKVPTAPKSAPAKTAPAAPPVQSVEVPAGSAIAGGVPVVQMPAGVPARNVLTPFKITDRNRQYAEEKGVDLSQVTPTGSQGSITKKDIDNAAAAARSAAAAAQPPVAPVVVATSAVAPVAAVETLRAEQPVHATSNGAVLTVVNGNGDHAGVAAGPAAVDPEQPRGAIGSAYDPVASSAHGANGPSAPSPNAITPAPTPAPAAPPAAPAAAPPPTPPPPAPTADVPVSGNTYVERRFSVTADGQRFHSAMDYLNQDPDKVRLLNIVDAFFEFTPNGALVVAVLDFSGVGAW